MWRCSLSMEIIRNRETTCKYAWSVHITELRCSLQPSFSLMCVHCDCLASLGTGNRTVLEMNRDCAGEIIVSWLCAALATANELGRQMQEERGWSYKRNWSGCCRLLLSYCSEFPWVSGQSKLCQKWSVTAHSSSSRHLLCSLVDQFKVQHTNNCICMYTD